MFFPRERSIWRSSTLAWAPSAGSSPPVADQWFVLPDNGLITGVARGRAPTGIWEITNPALQRSVVSPTFHGRDILAPAAAHLLRGGDPAELGPHRTRFVTLRNFEPTADEQGFVGEVIFRDAFGNLITNVATISSVMRLGASGRSRSPASKSKGLSEPTATGPAER